MMKIYKVGQFTRQYEEGKQPAGAVEVKKTEKVEAKAKKAPANKARKVKDK